MKKRIVIVCLLFVVLLTTGSMASKTNIVFRLVPESIAGDANRDGLVTNADAITALEMSVGSTKPNIEADVSKDGKVTSLDALMILQANT